MAQEAWITVMGALPPYLFSTGEGARLMTASSATSIFNVPPFLSRKNGLWETAPKALCCGGWFSIAL